MRLPVIPLAVAATLIGGTLFVLNRTGSPPALVLDAPDVGAFVDVDGIETEVAVSAAGLHAVIASGDLWIGDESGSRRITTTPEPESSPQWETGNTVLVTRGSATYRVNAASGEEFVHREDANGLTRSDDGREAFVRDSALWVARSTDDRGEILIDAVPETGFRSIRFSPDGTRLALIRTIGRLHGQLITVDLASTTVRTVVGDRVSENPAGVAWIDDRRLAYVTNRGGGIAVWHVDLDANTMVPLTTPLMERALAPVGVDVRGERILIPVHRFDTTIETLDGRVLVPRGEGIASEPAFSESGDRMAYVRESNGVPGIWVVSVAEGDPQYVTTGRHPRFSPNGLELVFARTGLDGNTDIWKTDIRTGSPNRLTDDPGLDDTPDWSSDGRTIIFYSEAGGGPGIWTVPSTGGQRVRWSGDGYWPRYSDSGDRVAYWTPEGVVVADSQGRTMEVPDSESPFGPPVWISDEAVVVNDDMRLPGPLTGPGALRVGPVLDQAPDGTWALEVIDIESTAIWRLDLQYTEE